MGRLKNAKWVTYPEITGYVDNLSKEQNTMQMNIAACSKKLQKMSEFQHLHLKDTFHCIQKTIKTKELHTYKSNLPELTKQ